MTAREAELLLGGYAAGILTDEERSSLFAAALDNQALFDALADEEGLRALMADPSARAELLRAVTAESENSEFQAGEQVAFLRARAAMPAAGLPQQDPEPAPAREGWWRKLFRPAPVAAFSAVAVAAIGLVVVMRPDKQPEFAQTAKVSESKAAEAGAARNDALPPAPASPGKPEQRARAVKSSEPELVAKAEVKEKARPAEVDRSQAALRDEEVALRKPSPPPEPQAVTPAGPPPASVPAAAPLPRFPAQSQPQPLSQSQSQAPSLSQSQTQSQTVAVEERKADTLRASAPASEAPAAARKRATGFGGAVSGIRTLEATPPFNFWIELGRKRTSQTEFKAGDSVRIVVEAQASGRLEATVDQQRVVSTAVRPRQRYTIPQRGSIRNEPGDRQVELTFQPATGDPIRMALRISFR